MVKIRWWGHACFTLETAGGFVLATDPPSKDVGFELPKIPVDAVTVSHDHYDHNAVNLLSGRPRVIKGPGRFEVGPAVITGWESFHDEKEGRLRGKNTVYVIELEGLKIGHLGDLGHRLDPEFVDRMGSLDVLFVPVGGVYTVDAKAAYQIVEDIWPRVVVPMHFKTPNCTVGIGPVDPFLSYFSEVERKEALEVEKGSLPGSRTVVVLDYRH